MYIRHPLPLEWTRRAADTDFGMNGLWTVLFYSNGGITYFADPRRRLVMLTNFRKTGRGAPTPPRFGVR
jgi:hypothetical protein